jgi:pilus assembly protein CpaF
VNAIIPPLAVKGSALTIRKFSADPFTAKDLVDFGTLTPTLVAFLDACVRGRLNILVSGGTGAGKTTLLNTLSASLPEDERIITIEDSAELRLQQPHVVSLEARPRNIEGEGEITIRDLVRNALRMRPDRIVVGEVRGGETLDMLQAMNTGHDGSISTIHANSPRDVLSRLETLALMAGMDLTIRAVREQVAAAVDLIVHVARLQDGVRRVTSVTEVVGMEGDVVTLQDLFQFQVEGGLDDRGLVRGRLSSTGLRPHFLERLADRDVHLEASWFAPVPGREPW